MLNIHINFKKKFKTHILNGSIFEFENNFYYKCFCIDSSINNNYITFKNKIRNYNNSNNVYIYIYKKNEIPLTCNHIRCDISIYTNIYNFQHNDIKSIFILNFC